MVSKKKGAVRFPRAAPEGQAIRVATQVMTPGAALEAVQVSRTAQGQLSSLRCFSPEFQQQNPGGIGGVTSGATHEVEILISGRRRKRNHGSGGQVA